MLLTRVTIKKNLIEESYKADKVFLMKNEKSAEICEVRDLSDHGTYERFLYPSDESLAVIVLVSKMLLVGSGW